MIGLYDNVATRLQDGRCPALLQVGTGTDAEQALEMMALGPDVTALVHPLSDVADPIRESGFIVGQRTVERFGVTLGLVFPGGFPQFEEAREQVKAALRGWTPPNCATPVEYSAGRTLSYTAAKEGGRWLHLLTFLVSYREIIEAQA